MSELPLDPRDRFALYRLCACPACDGTGKSAFRYINGRAMRCPECRGEGRTRQEVASGGTEGEVGAALIRCGWEGEWRDADGNPCAFGFLDRDPDCHECEGAGCGECEGTGKKGSGEWYVLPWMPSARNVSDAARVLGNEGRRKHGRS